MLTNYYTLRYVASTLHSILTGTTITQLYSQEKDELVISFSGETVFNLTVSCRADANICYLRRSAARARKNTVDVLSACKGASVNGVTILPADRTVEIALSDQRILVLQFFGVKANVFLVDVAGSIVDSFRTPRKFRGEPYQAPQAEGIYDFTALASISHSHGSTSLATTLKILYPNLGATLLREVLFRTGLDLSVSAASIDNAISETLALNFQQVLQEIAAPLPRIYMTEDEEPAIFSLISLHHADQYEERRFEDIHEAIDVFLSQRRRSLDLAAKRSDIISRLTRQVNKARHAVTATEYELQEGNRADDYERYGALLLANTQHIQRGTTAVELQGPTGPQLIPLEPDLSLIQNAQRYFGRAKRARLARTKTAGRKNALHQRIAAGEYLISLVENVNTHTELKSLMTTHTERLAEFGLGTKIEARAELPFRIFTVEGGFEVWAGKNSANNDLLTMKHAKPNDIWFHARGSSGSHVVLKVSTGKGDPSRRAKEQAAAIAAYYRRMRNAKTVPVAMTERTHVRKPKGAEPGTVILEREKVVFVEPGLPGGTMHPND